jgi:hypothetical protein
LHKDLYEIFIPGPLEEPHKIAIGYDRHRRNLHRIFQDFETETPKSMPRYLQELSHKNL